MSNPDAEKVAEPSAPKRKGGRPAKLGDEHLEVLRALVTERPVQTLDELGAAFTARTGLSVASVTLRRGLQRAGIERVLPQRRRPSARASAPRRYGYTDAHRAAGDAQRYPSSLTDAEWALAEDLFDSVPGRRGKPPAYSRRQMLDACCYVLRTGCAWRQLPKDLPPWPAVYKSFSRWAAQNKFEIFHDRLRAQWRARCQKQPAPSAGVLDSQATRHSPQGGEAGYDAGKQVKGRKRHLLVDTLGLLLAVLVTGANVQDRDAAAPVLALACAKYPSLEKLYVDSAYAGRCAQALQQAHAPLVVEVVRHPDNRNVGRWQVVASPATPAPPDAGASGAPPPAPTDKAFTVLPKRWVVERTHAWIERCRRLVMHHDRKPAMSTTWVWFAEARRLARRLTTNIG